eukprot:GHRR01022192.1.p1 GENE.GHRR01022192.1~~GHRR01022192.1.p1  ORF type:complete len:167 (+),score=39.73 GHRR01022192.1:150-650(+)
MGKDAATIPAVAQATPSKRLKPAAMTAHFEPAAELLSKAQRILQQLNELYPKPPIPLIHETSFQLLVAVMLSAQTTDKKVSAIQTIIQPIGLAPTKAKNLSHMSKVRLYCRTKKAHDQPTLDALTQHQRNTIPIQACLPLLHSSVTIVCTQCTWHTCLTSASRICL